MSLLPDVVNGVLVDKPQRKKKPNRTRKSRAKKVNPDNKLAKKSARALWREHYDQTAFIRKL